MTRTVTLLLAVLCVLGTACDQLGKVGGLTARHDAENRVRTMLQGWQAGPDGQETNLQTAVCQWARGVMVIADLVELGRAQEAFETWRGRLGYSYRPIGSFEITGTSVVPGSDPPVVRVETVIDGHPAAMLVQSRERIRWAD